MDLTASLVAVWRTLRSMRMALILLLIVSLAAVAGSLVPQVINSPGAVGSLYREHPLLARVYEVTGLFDVYGSWWFTLAYTLLLISLASCLGPRTRALVRALRHRPQPVRELEAMRHFSETTVAEEPDEALERARRVFRRRRYRVSRPDGEPGVAAEKGAAREAGGLLFHWSFFLLLVGVVFGKGFGFTGQATIVEGETFTEAHASYDVPPDEGRFFTEAMHRGFQVRLREFQVRYRPTGVPASFVSRVDIVEERVVVRRDEIRVNDPLIHDGVKLYQQGYGWAPVIRVRREGRLLSDGAVVFITDDPQDQRAPWRGVVKLPSLRPQVGVEFRLFPDPVAALAGRPMLMARDPFLAFTAYRGNLRLTRAQSVFSLDTTGLRRLDDGGIGVGKRVTLPGGVEIEFAGLREYTQLRVARDPGTGIVLLAAILLLAGLIPALFSSRRKVWVRAVPGDGGARLQVAGFALQRAAAFEDEFDRLRRQLVGVGTVRESS